MDTLAAAGYASHAFDYRGHGQAAGRRGYVGEFSEYVNDLKAFLDRVRAESPGLPIFLEGHSHGCLISGILLTGANAPKDIVGVIFTSPYYQLRIVPSAFQLFQAKVVGKVIPFLPVKNPMTEEMLMHDADFIKASREDALRFHNVTPKWFTESNAAQETLLGRAAQFKLPVLVMVGADDPIAHPDGGKKFYDRAGSADKKFVSYPGMLHEILNEVDRAKPLGEIVQWLNAHLPKAAA